MDKKLADVLKKIVDKFKYKILTDSRFYLEVDIEKQAAQCRHCELGNKYRNQYACVPLKHPVNGMKVRIDGRAFVNYAQFESGVVVPKYVERDAGLSYKTFIPHDSMICNFA